MPVTPPARSRSLRAGVALTAIALTVVLLAWLAISLATGGNDGDDDTSGDQNQAEESPSAPEITAGPSPSEPPPVCRVDARFVAGFMSPQNSDDATAERLELMGTDAVTFGGWIRPVDADEYPERVREALEDRGDGDAPDLYRYTVEMSWEDTGLLDEDDLIHDGDTEYGLVSVGDDAVVITTSEDGNDPFHSLLRTAPELDAQGYLGLPVPQMRTEGDTWLPDNEYADVVDGFNELFVRAYQERGADGYYLAMEMPLTDADHWNPVTDYYGRQVEIIDDVDSGATVLIAPYLEGRSDAATLDPATAADGYQKLLDLGQDSTILVAPQDGLGVGTTALDADDSDDHAHTMEDYFAALQEVDAEHLYVTIEAMTPGGGDSDSREDSTRDRVEEQLKAAEPYVQGAIGYQWAGQNSIAELPHLGRGACAAGVGELP
ncbi:MAG: DUF4434 domain-containing protein [Micrococcaceae bacterium]